MEDALISFMEMSETIASRVNHDLGRDVVALWHDESHMNRYFIDNPPTLSLNPNYCFAEEFIGMRIIHIPNQKLLH